LPYIGIPDKYEFYIHIILFLFLLTSGLYYAIIAFNDLEDIDDLKE